MTERQREFVPDRRTNDGERARANSKKFGSFGGETEGACSKQKDQRRRKRERAGSIKFGSFDGETEGVCSR